MKYEKPEIVAVGDALASVQSTGQKSQVSGADAAFLVSIPAYEADE